MSRHPYVTGGGLELEAVGSTVEAQMSQLFAMLRRVTRVDFSEYKPPTIGRRVARRMALHKIEAPVRIRRAAAARPRRNPRPVPGPADQCHQLLPRPGRIRRAQECGLHGTVQATPERQRRPSASGCPDVPPAKKPTRTPWPWSNFLARNAVTSPCRSSAPISAKRRFDARARDCIKETIEADVSPIRLRRFFHRIDSGYQISKSIRDLCIFSTQNVFSDPPFSRIDLVSCRNVMIYLSQSLQRRIIPVFHYALNPNGFLMIGNTEGLAGFRV